MPKLTRKITRKPDHSPTSLSDATVFSKKQQLFLDSPATKQRIAQLAKQLIQDIGEPLSHNGIIVGHIKILVKLTEEEFLFLSLTKLDQVDIKQSSQWQNEVAAACNSINLDVNVLVFGYSYKVIEEVVRAALAKMSPGYPPIFL